MRALGVRLDAPDTLPRGELLASNHISWLDAIAILAVEPVTFLAKREVSRWPVVGRVTRRVGTVYINRAGMNELPSTVARLADRLHGGHTVAVFPAGTTWSEPPGGRFRSAVFQAALDAGAPVRPVAISYTQGGRPSTVAAFVGDDTIVVSIARILRARDLAVHIKVHEPVDYESGLPARQARRALAIASYRAVQSGQWTTTTAQSA